MGYAGHWWASSEIDSAFAWHYGIGTDYGGVVKAGEEKEFGFSVRCVMD